MLSALFIGLVLTEAIEVAFGWAWGLRFGREECDLAVVVLANALTNPLAQVSAWALAWALPGVPAVALQLAVEAAVVVVEAGIYRSLLELSRPLVFSAAANALSYGIGVVLQLIL